MKNENMMYEEIDKATSALLVTNLIQEYATLLRIRNSANVLEEIDQELKVIELKMQCMGISDAIRKELLNS